MRKDMKCGRWIFSYTDTSNYVTIDSVELFVYNVYNYAQKHPSKKDKISQPLSTLVEQ